MGDVVSNERSIKNIVKIALKTLLDCFIGLMLILSSIFVLFPKFSLKINETLGLKKIQEYNYKMIYAKSDNIADLYNLIIFEEQQENIEEELVYLNEILARSDFYDFCKSIDSATIKRLNNKKLIVSSANVNGYLSGRKVYCLYSLDSKNVQSFVYSQTKNGKLKEYSFAVYIDLIINDENLAKFEKKDILEEFIVMKTLDENMNLVSMEDLIEQRIGELGSLIEVTTDENEVLILKYVLMRFYGANTSLYEILGETSKQEENLNLYNNLKTELG